MSAFEAERVSVKPASAMQPAMVSLSARFVEHPKLLMCMRMFFIVTCLDAGNKV